MNISEIEGWSILDGLEAEDGMPSHEVMAEAATVGHLVIVAPPNTDVDHLQPLKHPICVSAWMLKGTSPQVTLSDITHALEQARPHTTKRLSKHSSDIHYTVVTPHSLGLVTNPKFLQRMTDAMLTNVSENDGVRIWTRMPERLPTFPSGRVIAGDDRVRRIVIDTTPSSTPLVITLFPSMRMDATTIAFPPLNRDPTVIPDVVPPSPKEQCADWLAQNWVWVILGIILLVFIVLIAARGASSGAAVSYAVSPSSSVTAIA